MVFQGTENGIESQILKLHKENKIKNNNTYNMAVKRFLVRNKEISRHELFVGIRFPYIFLSARRDLS